MGNGHRKEPSSFEEILASIRQMKLEDTARAPTPKGDFLVNFSRFEGSDRPFGETLRDKHSMPPCDETAKSQQTDTSLPSIDSLATGARYKAANKNPTQQKKTQVGETAEPQIPTSVRSAKSSRQMACCKETRMAQMADAARAAWPGLAAKNSSATTRTSTSRISAEAAFGPSLPTDTKLPATDTNKLSAHVMRTRQRPIPRIKTPGHINDLKLARVTPCANPKASKNGENAVVQASTPNQTRINITPLSDSTAMLLRPLLMEWVQKNMPRVVETALRKEAANGLIKKIGP